MFQADLNTTVYYYPTNDSQDIVIIVHTLDKYVKQVLLVLLLLYECLFMCRVPHIGRFFVSNTFQDISDETM